MTFKELSSYFDRVASTSGRLEMTDILAEVFDKSSSPEVSMICYLMTGRVAPMFVPIEFNVAEKTIIRVLEQIAAMTDRRGEVSSLYRKKGDLGSVAEAVVSRAKEKMSVGEVYDSLWQIALVSGSGSVEVRDKKIGSMLSKVSALEAKYIIRILQQRMRLGSSDKTVLDALSVLKKGDKEDREEIERAYGVCSDLGHVAKVYLEKGVKGLHKMHIVPGVPVFSMLVEREADAEAIMKRIPRAIVQPKYDGIRCQIHVGVDEAVAFSERVWFSHWNESNVESEGLFEGFGKIGGRVLLYSRNLEEMTHMFPEVVSAMESMDIDSGIFDAEVIGYDDATGEFRPFQETMMRKRKYGVSDKIGSVPVRAFIFDVLMLDGESLVDEPNEERIAKLPKLFPQEGVIVASDSTTVDSAEALEEEFNELVSAGLEGVIVKDPGSSYQPGKRRFDWIKLKRASQGHLADTVDVVILGYYFGRGRQADFGIGALLSGVYDANSDTFVTIAKIGTGVTDDQWKSIKSDLDKIAVEDPPTDAQVDRSLVPDQWVIPKIVATVEADEITKSPVHTAGKENDDPGYALRFPRLKVWDRKKQPRDATHVKEIEEMYSKQGTGDS